MQLVFSRFCRLRIADISIQLSSVARRKITAPTLILKADDQGETRKQNIAVAEKLEHPFSRLVHVKGAGHNVRRDQKELALAALLPFLEKIRPPARQGAAKRLY